MAHPIEEGLSRLAGLISAAYADDLKKGSLAGTQPEPMDVPGPDQPAVSSTLVSRLHVVGRLGEGNQFFIGDAHGMESVIG
jgi:hypothetical protein